MVAMQAATAVVMALERERDTERDRERETFIERRKARPGTRTGSLKQAHRK